MIENEKTADDPNPQYSCELAVVNNSGLPIDVVVVAHIGGCGSDSLYFTSVDSGSTTRSQQINYTGLDPDYWFVCYVQDTMTVTTDSITGKLFQSDSNQTIYLNFSSSGGLYITTPTVSTPTYVFFTSVAPDSAPSQTMG